MRVSDNVVSWPAKDLLEADFTEGRLNTKQKGNAVEPCSEIRRGQEESAVW